MSSFTVDNMTFTSLSSSSATSSTTTHLYTPLSTNLPPTLRLRSSSPHGHSQTTPSIIILCAGSTPATSPALTPYLTGYSTTYPSAPILLLSSHCTRRSSSSSTSETAYTAALSATASTRSPRATPTILLHVFGASAEIQAAELAWAHRLATERPLEARAVIYDACLDGSHEPNPTKQSSLRHRSRSSSPVSNSSREHSPLRISTPWSPRRTSKSSDYNVLHADSSRLSVGQAFHLLVFGILAAIMTALSQLSAFATGATRRIVAPLRLRTTNMAGVHASRRDLDDPELVDGRAARCVVYPGAGHMAWYSGGEHGSGGANAGERRRDSGVAAPDGMWEQAEGARMPTETRFARVGDEAFWAGIESLVVCA